MTRSVRSAVTIVAIVIVAIAIIIWDRSPRTSAIAKIYNITPAVDQTVDLRFFRKGECSRDEWCRINRTGEYLKAGDWLQTGNVSRADLVLMYNTVDYRPVLFWQEEDSKSLLEFKEGSCHFHVELGKFLYAHSYRSVDKGCQKTTSKHALIFPHGSALFIIQSAKDTLVGVLSSPTEPVVVQNSHTGAQTRLRSGQFAKSFGDGSMQQGEFSLAQFYKTQTLGRGLGPESHDTDYVEQQEPAIRAILEEIRQETLAALLEQRAGGAMPQPNDFAKIDRVLETMGLGNIVFNAPRSLNLEETAQIQLLLSLEQSIEDLRSAVTAAGEREGHQIRVSNRMEARLTGPNFQITAITPEEQAITSMDITEWKWEVKPTVSGRHYLHLTVTALFHVDGVPTRRALRTFDKMIEVEVGWGQRASDFLRNNWQWLWTAILIPLAPWLWKKWKNRSGRGHPMRY